MNLTPVDAHIGETVSLAFVLIKTLPAREREVYIALSQLPEIVEVHALYGEFDLLVMLNTVDTENLTKVLLLRLRQIEGVRDTQTMIAVDY